MKEHPRHEVPVPALLAWKYPVTNADLRRWRPDVIGPDDHPARDVEVDEARAFAAWYAAHDGRSWRVPSEAEWEWLAAGPDRLTYPYGNEFDAARGNTVERRLGTTTPVDAHPSGASWCGAMDLAGNVEEWTSSSYAPYPGGEVVEDDLYRRVGAAYPIVRGGSFRLGGDLTRCARRHGPHYDPRARAIGFRLVCEAT